MKKIIICLLMFSLSTVYGATQYHKLGNVELSTSTVRGSIGWFMLSKAAIAALTPSTTGQIILCQNCVKGNSGTYNICISTGVTAAGQFIMVSTAAALLGCQ